MASISPWRGSKSTRAQDALARYGIDTLLGPGRMFRSVEEAIRALGGEGRPGPVGKG